MKKILMFLALGLLIQSSSLIEQALFTGSVIDKNTKVPLTGVLVSFSPVSTGSVSTGSKADGKQFEVYTDRYGRFSLNLVPGTYKITCSYFINIDTTLENVQVLGEKNDELVIGILPDVTSFNKTEMLKWKSSKGEIRVTSDKVMVESTSASVGEGFGSADIGSAPEASPLLPSDGKGISRSKSVAIDALDISMDKMPPGSDGMKDARGAANVTAGLLTSGEVNDFRKWEMWQDISANELEQYRQSWTIEPNDRYTVQITTLDGKPAVDCDVRLKTSDGKVIWAGKTDNTGKAELWADIFDIRSQKSEEESQNVRQDFPSIRDLESINIEVKYNGNSQKIESIKKFHDGINFTGINERCDVPENVDIMFTVDATGSMGDEIEYLKAELKDIIGKLKQKNQDLKFKLGSIFYRDIGDEYIVRKSDLSSDIDKTINFIGEQAAGGGGDYPEAVEMALQSSINEISWSNRAVARLLFLILDAPPHDKPEIKEKLRELTARAAMVGIRIIPVACSGVDKSTEYLMRSLALATNGSYVFLTDHSGIGNPHIEPTTDKYDVELLNDLFIRLIDQFTIVPPCSPTEPIKGEQITDNIFNKDEIKIDSKDKDYDDFLKLVNCYPNPTSGQLNIELDGFLDEMYLVDVAGKILVKIENLSEGNQMLDLSSYPAGIYFMKYHAKEKWGGYKVIKL